MSQQPFALMVANAAIQALHRPAAFFLPVVACSLSFRAVAMFLDVILPPPKNAIFLLQSLSLGDEPH